jgi:hypothetical protein
LSIRTCTRVNTRQNPADLFTRLAPVLNVRDVAAEREFCERLGLPVIYEGDEYPDFIAFGNDTVHFGIQPASAENDPPSVLTWQIEVSTPSGYRLALEEQASPPSKTETNPR